MLSSPDVTLGAYGGCGRRPLPDMSSATWRVSVQYTNQLACLLKCDVDHWTAVQIDIMPILQALHCPIC